MLKLQEKGIVVQVIPQYPQYILSVLICPKKMAVAELFVVYGV